MPQFLDHSQPDFEAAFTALLSAKREESTDVDDTVADIIAQVRENGDAAVIALTQQFDRIALTPDTLRITAAITMPANCPKTRNGRMRSARPWAGAGRLCRLRVSMCPAGLPAIRRLC